MDNREPPKAKSLAGGLLMYKFPPQAKARTSNSARSLSFSEQPPSATENEAQKPKKRFLEEGDSSHEPQLTSISPIPSFISKYNKGTETTNPSSTAISNTTTENVPIPLDRSNLESEEFMDIKFEDEYPKQYGDTTIFDQDLKDMELTDEKESLGVAFPSTSTANNIKTGNDGQNTQNVKEKQVFSTPNQQNKYQGTGDEELDADNSSMIDSAFRGANLTTQSMNKRTAFSIIVAISLALCQVGYCFDLLWFLYNLFIWIFAVVNYFTFQEGSLLVIGLFGLNCLVVYPLFRAQQMFQNAMALRLVLLDISNVWKGKELKLKKLRTAILSIFSCLLGNFGIIVAATSIVLIFSFAELFLFFLVGMTAIAQTIITIIFALWCLVTQDSKI